MKAFGYLWGLLLGAQLVKSDEFQCNDYSQEQALTEEEKYDCVKHRIQAESTGHKFFMINYAEKQDFILPSYFCEQIPGDNEQWIQLSRDLKAPAEQTPFHQVTNKWTNNGEKDAVTMPSRIKMKNPLACIKKSRNLYISGNKASEDVLIGTYFLTYKMNNTENSTDNNIFYHIDIVEFPKDMPSVSEKFWKKQNSKTDMQFFEHFKEANAYLKSRGDFLMALPDPGLANYSIHNALLKKTSLVSYQEIADTNCGFLKVQVDRVCYIEVPKKGKPLDDGSAEVEILHHLLLHAFDWLNLPPKELSGLSSSSWEKKVALAKAKAKSLNFIIVQSPEFFYVPCHYTLFRAYETVLTAQVGNFMVPNIYYEVDINIVCQQEDPTVILSMLMSGKTDDLSRKISPPRLKTFMSVEKVVMSGWQNYELKCEKNKESDSQDLTKLDCKDADITFHNLNWNQIKDKKVTALMKKTFPLCKVTVADNCSLIFASLDKQDQAEYVCYMKTQEERNVLKTPITTFSLTVEQPFYVMPKKEDVLLGLVVVSLNGIMVMFVAIMLVVFYSFQKKRVYSKVSEELRTEKQMRRERATKRKHRHSSSESLVRVMNEKSVLYPWLEVDPLPNRRNRQVSTCQLTGWIASNRASSSIRESLDLQGVGRRRISLTSF
ncbi:hypothetical protein Ciccas_001502 [Cichlidogyrus casuarinus]|uniref:Ig-like domain-containing protein n=1 Tax=Cichlidogyrus casuarinus TaxID=1844966 RepID=A0ABD2QK53_9PLAT